MKNYKVFIGFEPMEIEVDAENETDAIDEAIATLVKDYIEIEWAEAQEEE